jgi:DNA-binding NtrC family response regulator
VRNRSIAEPFYTKFLQHPAASVAKTAAFTGPFFEALAAPILHSRAGGTRLRGGGVTTTFGLVLERFVTLDGTRAVDLATGDLVQLRTTAGREDRAARRAQAAARLSSMRIPGMAPLVDYGASGRDEWVEAYRLAPSSGSPGGCDDPPLPAATIVALLAAAGCVADDLAPLQDAGVDPIGAALFVPLECVADGDRHWVGHPSNREGVPGVATVIERRDEVEPVAEFMLGPAEAGARIIRIAAPAGAGLRTFFEAVAREARLAGFVPASVRFCSETACALPGLGPAAIHALLRDRHVVVLDASNAPPEAAAPTAVARFLSRLDTTGGRPHVVVCRGAGPAGEPVVTLGPMRAGQLRRTVICAGFDAGLVERAVTTALRESGGWPGTFARAVRAQLGLRPAAKPYWFVASSAAEVREALPGPVAGGVTAETETANIDAVLERGHELAARGRHAAAERLLRRTVGYLHRRHRAAGEARAHLALGRLLLARGRRQDARDAFEESRRLWDEAQDAAGVVTTLLHLGALHIDDGALPAAESVLRTAGVGASHAGLDPLGRAAGLLLARCLYWQGRHEDSWKVVAGLETSTGGWPREASAVAERASSVASTGGWGTSAAIYPEPPGLSAVAAEIGVRAALGRQDAGLAARRLAAAGEVRAEHGPIHAATLLALRMLVQGALGDADAVARTAASGFKLMRRLHAPLATQEVRLAHLEALIDAGAAAPAAACLQRLNARPRAAASGLARLRLGMLAERLRALTGKATVGGDAGDGEIDTSAVLRILQHCHESRSESEAVSGVCQTVRTVLGASAVSAFVLIEGAMRQVASAGSRACRSDLAERAAASLLPMGPADSAAGRELAAPVRYGGGAVGALVVRWAPGASGGGQGRASGILAASAVAVGPALAALSSAPLPRSGADDGLGDLGGPSAAMAEVRSQVGRAAAAPYPVLILGESGTGKELIAKAIHAGSARRARRFCAVNCAALNDELFETELFGHARGSFTGAASDRPGLFEEADGGTLFLDEVGELSPRAQAKLLRAIQEGEIRRVGENHPRRVDARVVAATNRTLADEVKAGRFRHDLLYRLDVVRIVVPPLRDRPEDVGPLARAFWRDAMRRTGGQAELSSSAIAALARYSWPGNVRELQNTLAALAVYAPARGRVGPARLPAAIVGTPAAGPAEPLTLAEARRRFEAGFVRATLARAGGHRSEAASALGLSRQGLAKAIARLEIAHERVTPY